MLNNRLAGLSGKTKVLAVFGCPVEHSLSPAMHNAAIQSLGLDYVYVPFRVELDQLPAAVAGVRALGIAGVNLTIPLKERAVDLVDGLSERAQRTGSVNTLWWDDGRLMGDSTDGPGFLQPLKELLQDIPSPALVLGAGGSARAVCFALASQGIDLIIANRTVERAQRLAERIAGVTVKVIEPQGSSLEQACAESRLIINCTSVGMSPKIGESPLPSEFLTDRHVVYDLIYNPAETRLLQEARQKGAIGINGLKMLVYQGAFSFELWAGIQPPVDVMEQAIVQLL